MIFTMIFYLLSFLLTIIAVLLPQWQIWPDTILTAVQTFSQSCMGLNFLFPVADLMVVFLFFIQFEVYYITAKIAVKVFNYVRGTGSGLDL